MQVSVAISRQKHLYSIDHAKYFFTFNFENKNNEKIPASSQSLPIMCFSAVFWLSIVYQLAAIFCPSGYILTFGDTSYVKGLISWLESPFA